ncbi:acyltransferase family protein [uncultured Maricaulis sp.]|uniref:acyltransferase family protein n=1 Tax=uncultured Maricaulis sp. TaxID=174710 RepID=UPI0030D7B59C|tara:strand:- start:106446 stop:107645 length:1200 start_codon:yes stop_codon:yes gene_type:complete
MTSTASTPTASTRRYDLDWLRIIAFGLLIFYHIGMFFNTEDWHAKSTHMNDAMEPLMWLSSPWRLPLLFFISGVAIRFLSDKLGAIRFAGDRFWRLFPVILFGMYVIVAPQTWVQLQRSGEIGPDFWTFYQGYAFVWDGPWSIQTPTWNHLWYVAYLFVYAMLLAPLIPMLRGVADSKAMRVVGTLFSRPVLGPILMIALPVLPFMLIRFTLSNQFETTHNLIWDWANHANSFAILLYGYFFAKNEALWAAVDRALPWCAAITGLSLVYLYICYSDWSAVEPHPVLLWTARIDRIVFAWTIILTLLGLARRFLNRDNAARRYLTEAVFPYYILHQTIIVVWGFFIGSLGFGVWTEFWILIAVTVTGCGLGYELVKRVPLLRPVMGLKWRRSGGRLQVNP